ncbi:hypothetical protein BABINDRAFT_99506 [Babjeviella inositovora NRRL Y-12698]|uniref:Uncharacterized protein n=1 Tax=Babjeviella inositovora NRRL Y-12698 TaxID=984486 RepID=A0A1E3QJA7_9ASCO|nr:uncharacterized protein BABINDRAFT_99506 [Babjeviella inositovora NRRL Y-12698]ODQ77534.1 hypothetical protein BABINDRAFT_99506 [Babjeviella inositovora NRRL Y-12698]
METFAKKVFFFFSFTGPSPLTPREPLVRTLYTGVYFTQSGQILRSKIGLLIEFLQFLSGSFPFWTAIHPIGFKSKKLYPSVRNSRIILQSLAGFRVGDPYRWHGQKAHPRQPPYTIL